MDGHAVYVNGHFVAGKIGREDPVKTHPLPKSVLKKGRNVYAAVGIELMRRWKWEELKQDPGCIRTVVPEPPWKRSLFSGLAQVIVQSDKKPGSLVLKAESKGLQPAVVKIQSRGAPVRPSVPE